MSRRGAMGSVLAGAAFLVLGAAPPPAVPVAADETPTEKAQKAARRPDLLPRPVPPAGRRDREAGTEAERLFRLGELHLSFGGFRTACQDYDMLRRDYAGSTYARRATKRLGETVRRWHYPFRCRDRFVAFSGIGLPIDPPVEEEPEDECCGHFEVTELPEDCRHPEQPLAVESLADHFALTADVPWCEQLPASWWWGEKFWAEGDPIPGPSTCREREAERLCRLGESSLARGQLDLAYVYFAVIRHRYKETAYVAHAAGRSREIIEYVRAHRVPDRWTVGTGCWRGGYCTFLGPWPALFARLEDERCGLVPGLRNLTNEAAQSSPGPSDEEYEAVVRAAQADDLVLALEFDLAWCRRGGTRVEALALDPLRMRARLEDLFHGTSCPDVGGVDSLRRRMDLLPVLSNPDLRMGSGCALTF